VAHGPSDTAVKELITRPQADLLFTAGPILVALAAFAWWRLRKSPTALAAGVGAVLIGVLWRVFNTISERIGIETVANLLVNAAVFVVVGIGYGIWMRRVVPMSLEPVDIPLLGILSTEPADTDGQSGMGNAPAFPADTAAQEQASVGDSGSSPAVSPSSEPVNPSSELATAIPAPTETAVVPAPDNGEISAPDVHNDEFSTSEPSGRGAES